MRVCDKCKKNKVEVTLLFKTKEFEVCTKCASKIVAWLENKPLKDKMTDLWNKTNTDFGRGGLP